MSVLEKANYRAKLLKIGHLGNLPVTERSVPKYRGVGSKFGLHDSIACPIHLLSQFFGYNSLGREIL